MHTMNNQAMLEQIAINEHHFSQAPEAFFRAWKSGVQLLSPTLFGLGTKAHVDQAEDKWELCPNLEVIDQAIGVMSSGERVFLAAMVSFVPDGLKSRNRATTSMRPRSLAASMASDFSVVCISGWKVV